MLSTKKLLYKMLAMLANMKTPLKIQQYGWTVSPTFAERTRLLQNASPSNAGEGTRPSGYTFLCWIQFYSNGWIGAIYPSSPTNETTDVYTATAKMSTTSGTSIYGIALYIRTPLA